MKENEGTGGRGYLKVPVRRRRDGWLEACGVEEEGGVGGRRYFRNRLNDE